MDIDKVVFTRSAPTASVVMKASGESNVKRLSLLKSIRTGSGAKLVGSSRGFHVERCVILFLKG
jgi:hypothetical protein